MVSYPEHSGGKSGPAYKIWYVKQEHKKEAVYDLERKV